MNDKVAVIRNGQIVYGESADITQPNETEARANREGQKTKYRAEMLQKNQVDYYKVYPERAKELSPDLRRLLS